MPRAIDAYCCTELLVEYIEKADSLTFQLHDDLFIYYGSQDLLCCSMQYVVPYLLGWNTFVNAINPEDSNRANNSSTRTVDYEWSR